MTTLSSLDTTTLVSSSAITDTSSTSAEIDSVEEDKISFLNLLLTQLENQNPLDPMDTTEYAAQLVSYSQLEQQIEINGQLETLGDLMSESALTTNLSYIGSTVEISTAVSATANDAASWAYNVDGSASSVYLTITDESGATVWEGEGSIASGAQILQLDTSDSGISDGGLLTLSVNATDSDGESLDSDITSFVTVDGVQSSDGTTYLSAGGLSFTMADILKIST